jgi:hypothetical protein
MENKPTLPPATICRIYFPEGEFSMQELENEAATIIYKTGLSPAARGWILSLLGVREEFKRRSITKDKRIWELENRVAALETRLAKLESKT